MSLSPATARSKRWTYQDYLQLDDENRYEILHGELTMVPAPDFEHQRSSRDLEFQLWQYVKSKNLGEVVSSPIDLTFDDVETVQPDIVFIAKENQGIIQKRGIFGAPDLIVEIVSPSSVKRDYKDKKELYEKFGVKEYWIVDRANRAIQVYHLNDGVYDLIEVATENEAAHSLVIDGFAVNVADVITPFFE